MGTTDDDDGLIIIDDIRRDHDAELVIERDVLEGYWYRSVSWGARPVELDGNSPVHKLVSDFADGTLFVTWIPEWAQGGGRRRFTESIAADDDETFQASIFLRTRPRAGVYHSLLPAYFVPLALSSPASTRLVSVRRSKSRRLALTWLFSDGLEVHLRIGRVHARAFAELKAESLLETQSGAVLGGAILPTLDTLPANDDAWRTVADGLQGIDDHDGP